MVVIQTNTFGMPDRWRYTRFLVRSDVHDTVASIVNNSYSAVFLMQIMLYANILFQSRVRLYQASHMSIKFS